MKFAFIAKHRTIWPVAWLCEAMGVSRSGFHAWLNRFASIYSLRPPFIDGQLAPQVGDSLHEEYRE